MVAYALYRLPYQDHCILIAQDQGEITTFSSLTQLNGQRGFVIAPFAVTTECPIVLLRPDRVERMAISPVDETQQGVGDADCLDSCAIQTAQRDCYSADFAYFRQLLQEGTLRKVVLARCDSEQRRDTLSPEQLFMRACQRYPRQYVCLVSTPVTGTWLMATPEILVDQTARQWRTMALAGTMKAQTAPCWSDKNQREQQLVADYILQQLQPFASDIRAEGPHTTQAADLIHLRTIFHFALKHPDRLGDLLVALHPTPAVCGLPKQQAYEAILQHEHTQRSYYSGFMGMVDPQADTHLYVSLRCMQILEHEYRLYAGGGLLKESNEQAEWDETQAKLQTMLSLLRD